MENENKYIALELDLTDDGEYYISGNVEIEIENDANGVPLKVEYSSLSFLDEPFTIDVLNFVPMCSCKPNEKLLGGRRPGESYSDCIERNCDNFGTDPSSKLAQTFFPGQVRVAISVTCLGKVTSHQINN